MFTGSLPDLYVSGLAFTFIASGKVRRMKICACITVSNVLVAVIRPRDITVHESFILPGSKDEIDVPDSRRGQWSTLLCTDIE